MCRDVSTLRKMHTDGEVRASWRALRVLVVHGQQDAVNARVELTHRLGHSVCVAFDGFAALRLAVAYQPDVVLLDRGISLVDSHQIARHLRFDFPRKDVWIIAVTGQIDDVRRDKCIDAGIGVLLTDPVDPDVFGTLLMLECGRVNRSEADAAAALASEGCIPVRSLDNVN
jgi:CheY-like chemotaxis protein